MADRLNPFVEMDNYYTVVDSDGEYLGEDNIRKGEDSYQYQFTGYNKSGTKQDITINVTKELKQGAYLNVTAKGANGKTWFEVQADEVPEAAMEHLN